MRDLDLVVVGSIGIDTIETKYERQEEILGGSVSYACAAASFFAATGMVGVAGTDFPDEYMECYRHFGIDLDGLTLAEGQTFRWSGVYEDDMNNRRTLSTCLNVFADFMPELPEHYRKAPFLLLGNISPELQLHVLSQVESPKFVIADTMDLWINIADDPLQNVIRSVNMLTLNDGEARLLTQEQNLKACARRILEMGPDYVVIKKGEHGALLATRNGFYIIPAYPVDDVVDPTGAGDSFAGGFMGYLSQQKSINDETVCEALLRGSVVASFGVEAFSLNRLAVLKKAEIEKRLAELKTMIRIR
jgi:sugar/nucleoside kinase (ribokinase family)